MLLNIVLVILKGSLTYFLTLESESDMILSVNRMNLILLGIRQE